MRLFDLHCDTPHKLYTNNFHLDTSSGGVALNKLSAYDDYAQIMAVWSDCKISDQTSFVAFHKIVDYLNFEMERLDNSFAYVRDDNEFQNEKERKKIFLSVEDARLLCGRLDRLKILYARGVRFLIPLWGGISIIGGAHDTNVGLTDFGKEVITECFKLGIITDISHSSEKAASEICDSAEYNGKAVMASHSNSYTILNHSRNLRDYQFERIKGLGGIVGISLCSLHINGKNTSTVDDVVRHIEHYMMLGGENMIALGCDFDGTDSLPNGLQSVEDMPNLAERLAQLNYTDTQIDKIFYLNAKEFIKNNLNTQEI